MYVLAAWLVAIGCAAAAAYCATLVKRYAPYKARWLTAVRLLGELDEELRRSEEQQEALAQLANTLGAKAQVRGGCARTIHAAVQRELDAARGNRLAANKRREEEGWTTLSRTR
jgi:hypothetical protein